MTYLPITILLGIATLLSIFTTVSLGLAMHVFNKDVFSYHRFFAFLTITLATAHAVLAVLLWWFGIVI